MFSYLVGGKTGDCRYSEPGHLSGSGWAQDSEKLGRGLIMFPDLLSTTSPATAVTVTDQVFTKYSNAQKSVAVT